MKIITIFFSLLICFSCDKNSKKGNDNPTGIKKEEKIFVEANLVASFINYTNPGDRNIYYLVDIKLINTLNKDCEFYTLTCGALVNIVTDSKQLKFLYHNCSFDQALLITLHPGQEYSVSTILLRNKYISNFNYNVRFGFILSKPKPGPTTNHAIVTDLKLFRENQENVIWSDPVILTATNFNSFEIRDIINDSTYSISK